MSSTIAEKILARASGSDRVSAGDFVTARADRMMINENMILIAKTLKECDVRNLYAPENIYVIFDHFIPPPSAEYAEMLKGARRSAEAFKIPNIFPNAGVSHQVMCEKGLVRPGELTLGTDFPLHHVWSVRGRRNWNWRDRNGLSRGNRRIMDAGSTFH